MRGKIEEKFKRKKEKKTKQKRSSKQKKRQIKFIVNVLRPDCTRRTIQRNPPVDISVQHKQAYPNVRHTIAWRLPHTN